MSEVIGDITILYQDSNLLLFHVHRAGYSPMQHLFRIDGMYTIVSEPAKSQLIWKYWSLWDGKLYWSHEEIFDIEEKPYPNAFGPEYYEVVSSWVAEVILLRDKSE